MEQKHSAQFITNLIHQKEEVQIDTIKQELEQKILHLKERLGVLLQSGDSALYTARVQDLCGEVQGRIGALADLKHSNRVFCQDLTSVLGEVQRLHQMKCNIVASIEFLSNFLQFESAIAMLQNVVNTRQYEAVVPVLKKLAIHSEYFQEKAALSLRIKRSFDRIEKSKLLLKEFIFADAEANIQLNSNCFSILEHLNSEWKKEYVEKLVSFHLKNYNSLFRLNQRTFTFAGIVDRIDWFTGEVFPKVQQQQKLHDIPKDWELLLEVAVKFLFFFKKDIEQIISTKKTSSFNPFEDKTTILDSVKYCSKFEKFLEHSLPGFVWKGTLIDLFDEHLSSFLAEQEAELKQMIKRADFSKRDNGIFESSMNLILFLRSSLFSCCLISQKKTFVSLCGLGEKYTKKYIHMLIHEKKDEHCLRLNTLEYCTKSIRQFEDAVKGLAHESVKKEINLESLIEFMLEKSSFLIFCLQRDFAAKAEASFVQLKSIDWNSFTLISDCLPCVLEICRALEGSLGEFSDLLNEKCNFNILFDKIGELVALKINSILFSSKLHAPMAVEVFLMNFQAMTASFLRFNSQLVPSLQKIDNTFKCLLASTPALAKETFSLLFPLETPELFHQIIQIKQH